MEFVDKVWEYLKAETDPKKAGQIAEALGVEKKEVDKAIKTLKKEDRIESPKRCFYTAK